MKRRWRRWLLLGAAVLTLYLAREPLLRGAARLLVDEDTPVASAFVLVLAPGPEVPEAVRVYREEQAKGMLIIISPPNLAQRLGVVPPDHESARMALTRLGVAPDRLQVLSSAGDNSWDHMRCLGEWLDSHPGERVTFVCKRFQGRKWRYVLNTLLPPEGAGRVRLRPVPNPEYDERHWWRFKEGQLAFFDGVVCYAQIRLVGEEEVTNSWDPDLYEKTLQPSLRSTPPLHVGRAGNAGPSSWPRH